MNAHQAIGGAHHFEFTGRGKTLVSAERLAAEGCIARADYLSIEYVQDAVVVDAPVQIGSAPAAHAPTVNTGTVSHRTRRSWCIRLRNNEHEPSVRAAVRNAIETRSHPRRHGAGAHAVPCGPFA